jgi:hypothetical protein
LGKPYSKDLENLHLTARWAESADVSGLADFIAQNSSLALLTIGSGGSQSVASFAAMLHRHYADQPAEESTPLMSVNAGSKERLVQLFTASGANPDVLGCFSEWVVREPAALMILSSSSSSPLADRARKYWYTEYFGFDGPFDGEGFVATNSILAQTILMKRAYEMAFAGTGSSVTQTLEDPVIVSWLSDLEATIRRIGIRRHLLVLFGGLGRPAAIDLESKFSEVGLASVQLADFRNFAHGRHNWLDKHPSDTLVVSIEVGPESLLAARTLRLLPPEIPVLRISVKQDSHLGAAMAMIAVMRLTGAFGTLRKLDPGRPGVPPYGSRLYRLNAWSVRSTKVSIPEISVARKAGLSLNELRRTGKTDEWLTYFDTFIELLSNLSFNSLALDYDGTLCEKRDRFRGLSAQISDSLEAILKSQIPILVITGRGKSVGDALRSSISKKYWELVRVAYYSGSEDHPLGFDGELKRLPASDSILFQVASTISAHPRLDGLNFEVRHSQLTIASNARTPPAELHSIVSDLLSPFAHFGLRAVTSAHSVDILMSEVSKRRPLNSGKEGQRHLCIGDGGEWPGNDYELLQETGSLSCHQTSYKLDCCWHISPPGWRNSQSTLHYFSCLERASSGFRVDVKRLVTGHK